MFGSINEQLESMTQLMAEQRTLDAFDRQAMEVRLQGVVETTVATNLEPIINEMASLRENVAEIHSRTVGLELVAP